MLQQLIVDNGPIDDHKNDMTFGVINNNCQNDEEEKKDQRGQSIPQKHVTFAQQVEQELPPRQNHLA